MAHVGETIEQPLTGERLTFLETAATTGGDFLKISMEMRTRRPVASASCPPAGGGAV